MSTIEKAWAPHLLRQQLWRITVIMRVPKTKIENLVREEPGYVYKGRRKHRIQLSLHELKQYKRIRKVHFKINTGKAHLIERGIGYATNLKACTCMNCMLGSMETSNVEPCHIGHVTVASVRHLLDMILLFFMYSLGFVLCQYTVSCCAHCPSNIDCMT